MDGEKIKAAVKRLAADIGYAECGIASVAPFDRYARALRERIARFPEAAPLYAPMSRRADLSGRAPWAASIVVCVRRYGKYRLPPGLEGHIGRNYLADLRYEGCPDHAMPKQMTAGLKALGLKLRKGGLPDREAAARAGVCRIGRNGFAFSAAYGSWINLETWAVSAQLPPDPPAVGSPCPQGCRKCIDACPTRALVEPYVMRMDRCIAHLTYGANEPIQPGLWERMGPWIYGCDRCQEVCPLNEGKWAPLEPAPWLEQAADRLRPNALAAMDEDTYLNVVHPLFWYIPPDNAARWRRNATRAAACTCGRSDPSD